MIQQPQQQQYFQQAPLIQQFKQYAPQEFGENSIYIANIEPSLTEAIIWQKFKECGEIVRISVRSRGNQRGWGQIEFQTQDQVERAIQQFNLKALIDTHTTRPTLITVCRKKTKEQMVQINKNFFHFKLSSSDFNPILFQQCLSKIANLHLIKLKQENKKNQVNYLPYGQVKFDTDKQLEIEGQEFHYNDGQKQITYTFSKFIPSKQRQEQAAKPNYQIYVTEFWQKEYTEQQLNDPSFIKQEREVIQKFITEKYSSLSKITSVEIQFSHKHQNKPFSFITFAENFDYDKVYQIISNAKVQIIQSKTKVSSNLQNIILLKNLKKEGVNREEQEQKLTKLITDKIAPVKLSVKEPKEQQPAFKTYRQSENKKMNESAFQAICVFNSEADAFLFLQKYTSVKEMEDFFVNGNVHQQANIKLSAYERAEYKKVKKPGKNFQQTMQEDIEKYNLEQFNRSTMMPSIYSQLGQLQSYNFQPFTLQRMQGGYSASHGGGNIGIQQQPFQQQFHQRRPYQNRNNTQGRKPVPGQGYYKKPHHPNQNFMIQQAQQQFQGQQIPPNQDPEQIEIIQQQQQYQIQFKTNPQFSNFEKFEFIKQNLDKFSNLEEDQQKKALGSILFEKTSDHLQQSGLIYLYPPSLVSKITGMLIDFSVFDLSDIFEMIENESELLARILEAIQLIEWK